MIYFPLESERGVMEKLIQDMNGNLARILWNRSTIDELAVMVRGKGKRAFYRSLMHSRCLDLVNSAVDEVETFPIESKYRVAYDFYPDLGFRWEVMDIFSGVSPLHSTFHSGQIVHASFKCEDESDYSNALALLSVYGWTMAQSCRSTYGAFSYWMPPVSDIPYPSNGVYLKPRVNLRDAK